MNRNENYRENSRKRACGDIDCDLYPLDYGVNVPAIIPGWAGIGFIRSARGILYGGVVAYT